MAKKNDEATKDFHEDALSELGHTLENEEIYSYDALATLIDKRQAELDILSAIWNSVRG